MKKQLLAILFAIGALIISAPLVFAQGLVSPELASDLASSTGEVASVGALATTSSIGSIVAMGIRAVLGLLAIIFLALMLMAGFKWMTAQGNEKTVEEAQKTIKSAAIGLVIVLAAFAITTFIFEKLPFGGVGGGPQGGGS